MKVTICDLCGKICKPSVVAQYRIQCEETAVVKLSQHIDLCQDCTKKFDELIDRNTYLTTENKIF